MASSNSKIESIGSLQVLAGGDVVLKNINITGEVNYPTLVGNVKDLTRDILEKVHDENIENKEEIMDLCEEIIERPTPKLAWLGERVEELILLTSRIGTIAGVLQELKTLTGLE